jgi:hypothetical protein
MDAESYSEENGWMSEPEALTASPSLLKSVNRTPSAICDLQISAPSATEESRLFDLIGKIDHKVLQGYSFYIQVRGIAYKVLYGVYWRSIYTEQQFWGLRCEEIERGMWADDEPETLCIDLPIRFTEDGWTVESQSLQFLLNRDLPLFENTAS